MEKYIEDTLVCPITQQIFKDPVFADDGHVYEEQAILEWLQKNNESPMTRKKITNNVRPAHFMRGLVDKFLEENPDHKKYQFREFEPHGKNKNQVFDLLISNNFTELLHYTDFILNDQRDSEVFMKHLFENCVDENVIEHVLNKSKDVNCTDVNKWRPFHYIFKHCPYDLIKKLTNKYKNKWSLYDSEYSNLIKANYSDPNLYEIVIESDRDKNMIYDIVKYLIVLGVDINTYDSSYGGYVPIHFAIKKKYAKIVELLVKSHANLELTTSYGYSTTIIYACRYGNLEIIKYLFDAGCSLTDEDLKHYTPLLSICRYQPLDTIKFFINYYKSRQVNIKSYHRCYEDLYYHPLGTILNRDIPDEFIMELYSSQLYLGQDCPHCITRALSKSNRNNYIIKFIISNLKIDVNNNTDTYNGWYLIHYIIRYCDIVMFKHFLNNVDNIDLNCKNDSGETPLIFALRYGSADIIEYLLDFKSVDVNISNNFNISPLMIAFITPGVDSGIIKYLIKKTKNLELSNSVDNRRAINYALEHCQDINIIKYLTRRKVNMNFSDKNGNPVAFYIFKNKNPDAIRYMISRRRRLGVSFNRTNNKGESLLHYVAKYINGEALALFLQNLKKMKYKIDLEETVTASTCEKSPTTGIYKTVKNEINIIDYCSKRLDSHNKAFGTSYSIAEYGVLKN
jgi:ankyrin repeat protein